MRGLVLITVGALVLGVAAVLGPAAFAGKPKMDDEQNGISRVDLIGVNFIENCRFSHQAPDDPIVFPGKPGRRTSTRSSAIARRARSRRSARFARGRRPACVRTTRPRTGSRRSTKGRRRSSPRRATIYYRRGTLAEVSPFPNNLRMIAGDATATSPQGMRVTFWSCGIAGGVDRSATVPTCPNTRGSFLRLHIRFPECWDGRSLDSVDHKSHMAYATRAGCPSTHPVEVPQITQIYRYATQGGEGFSLASGGQYSAPRGLRERVEAGRAAQARRGLPERARPLRARLAPSRRAGRGPGPPTRHRRAGTRVTPSASRARSRGAGSRSFPRRSA